MRRNLDKIDYMIKKLEELSSQDASLSEISTIVRDIERVFSDRAFLEFEAKDGRSLVFHKFNEDGWPVIEMRRTFANGYRTSTGRQEGIGALNTWNDMIKDEKYKINKN